jgi:hypothetical protein
MRRVLVVILGSLLLALGVAGCGGSYGSGSGSGSSPAASSNPGY